MQTKVLTRLQLGTLMMMCSLQWLKFFYWLFLLPDYQWIIVSVRAPIWSVYYGGPTFGTAISPYGTSWYYFFKLISVWGFYPMVLIEIVLDTMLFIYLYDQKPLFLILASISSFFLLTLNPIDMLALWFAILSRKRWWFSILAFCTKLPVGSEIYFRDFHIWSYIWNVSFNSGGLLGYPILSLWRYILLGLWIISPLFYWLRRKI
jgi:hypothetical protein